MRDELTRSHVKVAVIERADAAMLRQGLPYKYGEAEGHPFRGNQWTSGEGGGSEAAELRSKNPKRDDDIRQAFVNGATIPEIAAANGMGEARVREILRDKPLPDPTVPRPPGWVKPTFKPRPPRTRGATPTPTVTPPPAPVTPPPPAPDDPRTADEVLAAFVAATSARGAQLMYENAKTVADNRVSRFAAERAQIGKDLADARENNSEQDIRIAQEQLEAADRRLADAIRERYAIQLDEYTKSGTGAIALSQAQMREALVAAVNPGGAQGSLTVVAPSGVWNREQAPVEDFYKSLGVKIGTPVRLAQTSSSRSYYLNGGHVNISRHTSSYDRSYAHELGHHLEWDNGTVGASKSWRDEQARGEKATHISGCRRDETGYKDKFIDHYVGKLYPDATEVVSMGMEWMWKNPEGFAQRAPEHFKYMVDVIRRSRSKA